MVLLLKMQTHLNKIQDQSFLSFSINWVRKANPEDTGKSNMI